MRYRVNDQVINETIDGEAVMINLATGNYYSLDRVGAEIWEYITRAAPTSEIVHSLCLRYEASPEEVEMATLRLEAELLDEGLIVVCEGDSGTKERPPVSAAPDVRAPFQPPTLQKFSDMQDLILLDPVHEVDARGWPHVSDAQPT